MSHDITNEIRVRRFTILVHSITGRWYLNINSPLGKQRNYTVFRNVVMELLLRKLSVGEYLKALRPSEKWNAALYFRLDIMNEVVHTRKPAANGNRLDAEIAWLRSVVSSFGENPLYVLNVLWNQLSPQTQTRFIQYRDLNIVTTHEDK